MEDKDKEVYFDKCQTCKYRDQSEFDPNSICYDCMYGFSNTNSHKPIYYQKGNPKK